MLEAILVRPIWGRVGSTLMMALLLTSEDVAGERRYPFEHRYLSRFVAHLNALERLKVPPPADVRARLARRISPPPVPDVGLRFTPTILDVDAFRQALLPDYWRRFSEQQAGARLYAEKASPEHLPDPSPLGIPHRIIHLVRDPRDVWASTNAFDERRGFYGFGRRPGQSRRDYLDNFIEGVRDNTALYDAEGGELVRYEDMMADLPAVAARIGEWLGVALDAAAVPTFDEHVTAPGRSVGRWRDDLPADEATRLTDALQPELAGWGYGD